MTVVSSCLNFSHIDKELEALFFSLSVSCNCTYSSDTTKYHNCLESSFLWYSLNSVIADPIIAYERQFEQVAECKAAHSNK